MDNKANLSASESALCIVYHPNFGHRTWIFLCLFIETSYMWTLKEVESKQGNTCAKSLN